MLKKVENRIESLLHSDYIAITLGSVLVIIYRYRHYRNITAQTTYA